MKTQITMKLLITFILLSGACFGQPKKDLSEAPQDVYEDTWFYKVNGEVREYTTEQAPWNIEGAEFVDRETKLKAIELEEQNKSSDFQFNLIVSNEREGPIEGRTIADYKIKLVYGNTVVAIFEDFGSGYLSDEKDIVWIRTDAGSQRTYTFESNNNDEVSITQHFFLHAMSIDRDTWIKTYKKDVYDHWKLLTCEGDCD
tara:strand:- start:696 stop:1295 length:600 start_codon:yes stop_codon:yes gene_type:complete